MPISLPASRTVAYIIRPMIRSHPATMTGTYIFRKAMIYFFKKAEDNFPAVEDRQRQQVEDRQVGAQDKGQSKGMERVAADEPASLVHDPDDPGDAARAW